MVSIHAPVRERRYYLIQIIICTVSIHAPVRERRVPQ